MIRTNIGTANVYLSTCKPDSGHIIGMEGDYYVVVDGITTLYDPVLAHETHVEEVLNTFEDATEWAEPAPDIHAEQRERADDQQADWTDKRPDQRVDPNGYQRWLRRQRADRRAEASAGLSEYALRVNS